MFEKFSYLMPGRRKAEEFLAMPRSDGKIFVQSDRSCGVLDFKTGAGRLYQAPKKTTYSPGFAHMAYATPFQFPPEFVAEALKACPSQGGETNLYGVAIVSHTIQIIG